MIVFEMLQSHGELNDDMYDLLLVGEGKWNIIERLMADVLHHNVEIVLLSEGSVASDDVGMIEAIRDEVDLVIYGCYFQAFLMTVKFQGYLCNF